MPLFDRLREDDPDEPSSPDGVPDGQTRGAVEPAAEPLPPAEARAPGRRREAPEPLRVSQIHRAVAATLDRRFGDLWVIGELSNVRRNAQGHVYFTLNDLEQPAALQGVMFQSKARRSRARLEDGALVRFRGRLEIYARRGAFQLVAQVAVPAGDGDLHAELELRRQRLAADGLLAEERKRPLPPFPRVVGVVTSRTGAALGDIVRVARQRCPVRIVVADCRVQGAEAAGSVRRALRAIQRLPDLDVVIVGRGGGASDDLWAFNDEALAREIAACRVPTVSAVGHQQDVTLADLVADARAPTPSGAAALVVPEREVLQRELASLGGRLQRGMEAALLRRHRELARRRARLGDPGRAVAVARGLLGARTGALTNATRARLRDDARRLRALEAGVRRGDPKARLARDRASLVAAGRSLSDEGRRLVTERRALLDAVAGRVRAEGRPAVARGRADLGALAGRLDALSPLRVLERGYAIALDEDRGGRALVDAGEAAVGDRLTLAFPSGNRMHFTRSSR